MTRAQLLQALGRLADTLEGKSDAAWAADGIVALDQAILQWQQDADDAPPLHTYEQISERHARLRVRGGWVYQVTAQVAPCHDPAVSLCFVPDAS